MAQPTVALSCAAAAPSRAVIAPQYIIADSGSGVHIVGRDELPKGYARHVKCADRAYRLNTANGRIKAQRVIELESKSLGSPFEAVILDSSPCAISLGRYCQDLGYSFHWPRGSHHPYMINQAGNRVNFTVINYVPYVDSNGEVDGFVNEVVPPSAAPAAAPDEAAVEAAPPEPQGARHQDHEHDGFLDDGPEEAIYPTREGGKKDATPRDLVKEAESVAHLMTHLPKNPRHCSACQRAKIQAKHAGRKLKNRKIGR